MLFNGFSCMNVADLHQTRTKINHLPIFRILVGYWVRILFSLYLLIASCHASANNIAVSTVEAVSAQIQRKMTNRDFDGLCNYASDLLKTKAKLPTGWWLLSSFYSILNDSFRTLTPEEAVIVNNQLAKLASGSSCSDNAALIYAHFLRLRGWAIRGGDYAYKVPVDAWPKYYAYLDRADKIIQSHAKQLQSNPEYYNIKILLENEGKIAQPPEVTLELGIKLEPGYYDMYISALRFYMPKWHGNLLSMIQFMEKLEHMSQNIESKELPVRLLWSVMMNGYWDIIKQDSPLKWEVVRNSMDAMIMRYDSQYNLNALFLLSCARGDFDETSKISKLITRQEYSYIFGENETPAIFAQCMDWVHGNLKSVMRLHNHAEGVASATDVTILIPGN